jgi:photoactive yellow protein
MNITETPRFDSINLAEILDQLSDDEINALPFGVIQIGSDGTVKKYSKTEAEQSGYGAQRKPPIGLDFFTQLAPCMNTVTFRDHIEKAAKQGKVDIECGHIGDYADRNRHCKVRILSSNEGGFWQIHNRSIS